MSKITEKQYYLYKNLLSPADWDSFRQDLNTGISDYDFNKIKIVLEAVTKGVVIEFDYICKDYRNIYHNFYSKKFGEHKRNCLRLHFFNSIIPEDKLWEIQKYTANYIGYIVIFPLSPFSIGRTMLDPNQMKIDNATLLTCENEVNLLGTRIFVNAFPFMEQNTDVTICAHAAIWMVLRYFSQRYPYYREVYPFDISELTKDVSGGRLIPSRGLTVYQISEIFSNYGMYPDLYIKGTGPGTIPEEDFKEIIYYYIESGIPLVIGLNGEHAVAALGHCSNLDFAALKEYDYEGFKYFNSADLITGYIINDDNALPYQYLFKSPRVMRGASGYSLDDMDSVVVPLYEKIFLSADSIKYIALSVLNHEIYGFKKLSKLFNNEKLILRIFLTSSRSYKKFRKENPIYADLEKIYIELPMPKFIWVIELSTVDKYKQKKIIGELIFDSTANKYDAFPFMYIHYPGFLLINDRNMAGDDPVRFSTKEIEAANIKEYDMYVHNLRRV